MLRLTLTLFGILVAIFIQPHFVKSFGMMLSPPSRSSRWRVDTELELINLDDNNLDCGGCHVLYDQNDGKCGLCGDNFSDETPRANELGGTYGQGVIIYRYGRGMTVDILMYLGSGQHGYIKFDLCNLDEFGAESEECFQQLQLYDGSEKFSTRFRNGYMDTSVQLPNKTCDHCVLRWNYSYLYYGENCKGRQKIIRNCADISILESDPGEACSCNLVGEDAECWEDD